MSAILNYHSLYKQCTFAGTDEHKPRPFIFLSQVLLLLYRILSTVLKVRPARHVCIIDCGSERVKADNSLRWTADTFNGTFWLKKLRTENKIASFYKFDINCSINNHKLILSFKTDTIYWKNDFDNDQNKHFA